MQYTLTKIDQNDKMGFKELLLNAAVRWSIQWFAVEVDFRCASLFYENDNSEGA